MTKTFDAQDTLPKLPIPELADSLKHYARSVSVLQTPEEHAATQKKIDSFLAHDGAALQEKLIEYAKDKNSFIEDFWYEAYFNYKASVVLNVNPFFVLEDDPTPSRANQVSRATSLIVSSLKFIHALRTETMKPDVWRTTPLCMNQFRMLFATARCPTETNDAVQVAPNSKHIVIVCRNQFYWFDVMWEDGTAAITEREIMDNLRRIVDDANSRPPATVSSSAVGVLTTEHRVSWAKLRKVLHQDNAETLAMIDRALFLVCLDHTSPPTASDFASTALHGTYEIVQGHQTGTCMNRWYDKLQIIVCDNGVAGVNFEHSVVDGHTVLRFASDVFTDTVIRFAQSISGTTQSFLTGAYRPPTDDLHIAPVRLEWKLNAELLQGIRFAEARLSDLIVQNQTRVLEFKTYGKSFITKHNCSPDAFVQIAFLAAYYLQYGTIVNQYEPAMTKRFLHGRTEAIRSMTPETKKFLELFVDENANLLDQTAALRAAVQSHSAIVKRCVSGQGVERHLYALQQLHHIVSPGEPEPAFFTDDAWLKLGRSVISTSNCGNPSLRLFGFGPVVPEGFGIGYIIKDDGIQFCVASKHRQTQRYCDTLESYLLQMQAMLTKEESVKFPNSAKPSMGRHRAASIEDTGYGFFDGGASEQRKVTKTPLVGRQL
ncbi:hypothetical protein, variant [Aphanomyces astaci]|uniref:Choline/carnitine acyltransferase domain-containing protein n=1 Tax=Aphanomyces astaci TaxID=112090 RepID=W4FY13_APHAT|nr:hypothetical protein, variant [Aphanomyces astaci]ETV71669.1 hypothetical protein, variant [Aphanomyces astaci]|eukprot:XP_009838857.1 hypothetical protein, variant [Aphanomyces astaci]